MSAAEEALSEFVAALSPRDLPEPVRERVRLHILDAIACGLAGAGAEHRADVAAVADAVFGPGDATVLADAPRAAGGAVLLNGFQIAAPTLGDVHRATLTHVMPEVLPAALAAAQLHGSSGQVLFAGIAAGMEVTVRVAEALDSDAYRQRGWHNPGIAGAFGAACAAAHVAGLDARGVRVAMGHAASQAAGTFAALGTSGVKIHQARGGLSGLLAAELTAAGVDASESALTAERGGLLAAYADGGIPDRLVDRLGEPSSSWRLESIALRRWPGASSLQPVIDAVLALLDDASDVVSVRVDLPPRAYALNGTSGWETRLAALQSARWTVAVAVADGDLWLDQTSDVRRADERVARFAREAVTVTEDATLPLTGARVTLRDGAGRERTRQVDVPPGDPERPLTAAEIEQKLERAAAGVGLGDRVSEIIASVAALESAESIGRLAGSLEVR